MNFVLDPQLVADTRWLARLPLCELLLANDARYPWTILVPRRSGVAELIDLDRADQIQLLDESAALSAAMRQVFGVHRLNVAKLGNIVAQLHLHHIIRKSSDAAWPGPVWGRHAALPYPAAEEAAVGDRLLAALAQQLGDQIST
jgi:diadenosine tetraphosphate (Ap4A) HIT family hydrolase